MDNILTWRGGEINGGCAKILGGGVMDTRTAGEGICTVFQRLAPEC